MTTDMPNAQIDWDEQGRPHSRVFDDVYFSDKSGLEETRYVFIEQNALSERFSALPINGHLVIGETGFGTGPNFLCAWQLFDQCAPSSARLHFISAEKYPLSREDLEKALALWPELAAYSEQLMAAYVAIHPGFQTLTLANGRVTLTLLIGDAQEHLAQLDAHIDAWFLDGFAPAKNPDMWTPELFAQLARLAAPDATISTFTSTYANDDFIKVSGYSLSELLGNPHSLLRHPDMPSAAFSHMWQTLKAGRSWMGMVKNRCKNGDHYWVSAYVTPVMKNGEIVEYQSVRTCPSPECVQLAEADYAELRSGRTPLWQRLPRVRLAGKLALFVSAVFAGATALGTVLLPSIDWQAGVVIWLTGSLLSSVAIAWLLRPLNALTRRAQDVGHNPLSQHIYTGRRDEMGQIAFALQMLEAQTGAMVGRIGDASQRLAGHASELVQHLQSSHSSTDRKSVV